MRTLLVVIIAGCLAVPALALSPSTFIGANLQINSPTGKFGESDIMNKEGGAKTGMGGEVDVGIATNTGDLYAGYRFGKHNVNATINGVKTEGDWSLSRFVVGLRWRLLGSLPLTPTIGGGMSFGATKLTTDASGTTPSISETSNRKMGWFVEAGGVFQPPSAPLSFQAGIQYHKFTAWFDKPPVDDTFDISFYTFQVGLRYMFASTML